MTAKLFSLMKKLVNQGKFMSPDFIAHKNGKHYLGEIKTNIGFLESAQKIFLQESKKIGFLPMLIKVDLPLDIKIKKILL